MSFTATEAITGVKLTSGGQTLFEGTMSDLHPGGGNHAALKGAILECLGKTIPMKNTDADRKVEDAAYNVTAAELRQFIEQYEQLEAEKKDIAGRQKEVMAEAKGRGYDTKVIRKLIALRKRDKEEVAEEEAVLAMYKAALGIG